MLQGFNFIFILQQVTLNAEHDIEIFISVDWKGNQMHFGFVV